MTVKASPVILVPLDGSELAEGALWVAARVARALQGMLRLVAVRPPREDADEVEATRRDLRQYLSAKADEVATVHGTQCDCAVLQGWPPEAIANHLASAGGRVVIMTAHGQSGVSPSWIGSTTEGVLARATVPVLVLRPETAPPHARFERVLVAMDQSSGAGRVLQQALVLGSPEGAPAYALARVIEPRKEGPLRRRHETAERIDGRIAEAAKDLERAASRLRRRHITVTTHVVTGANVAEQLIGLARALGCDAIVVGSQSLHERTRLPLGKVADKVLRGATQPVLLVPVARRRARQAGGDAARPRNRREGVGKRQPA